MCRRNEHAITGGFEFDKGINVRVSRPVTNEDGILIGWTVTADNETRDEIIGNTFVTCA
ncbi:MAG: hypothetical protein ACKOWF_05140 [Chloroflexota bacterium]